MLLFFSFFNNSSLTYSSSALLLCFLRHLVSQLLWNRGTENACVGLRNKSIFQIKPKLSDKCGENKQTNSALCISYIPVRDCRCLYILNHTWRSEVEVGKACGAWKGIHGWQAAQLTAWGRRVMHAGPIDEMFLKSYASKQLLTTLIWKISIDTSQLSR